MLGWHNVPTGFVPCPTRQGAEPVSKSVLAWNAGSCCQHFNYSETNVL